MKLIKMEQLGDYQDGQFVLMTATNRFLRKPKIRTFVAVEDMTPRIAPNKYWQWLELPDHNIVPDSLSLQLDAWLRVELNTWPGLLK